MSRREDWERKVVAQEEIEVGEERSNGMWMISGNWGLGLDEVDWSRVERIEWMASAALDWDRAAMYIFAGLCFASSRMVSLPMPVLPVPRVDQSVQCSRRRANGLLLRTSSHENDFSLEIRNVLIGVKRHASASRWGEVGMEPYLYAEPDERRTEVACTRGCDFGNDVEF